ncbi:HHL072Cp [Eremothecium sinecaudum]|uniref:HHL072Cp n=1 Tax=Eremothecium sinecaudum TaxID=45286 RepID=A0A109V0Q9_9SACH|nr:HHL072Cp [Eremothecium sinecaudum]AMD22698.1 HHL072Cp [Eremothecium sinecaudum]
MFISGVLYWFCFLYGVVLAQHEGMNMDMSANHMPGNEKNGSLEPVPHESKHNHGMPILMTDLTPAERKYWESYNTTTYFTMKTGNKKALTYHAVTLFSATVVTYPVSMVLKSAGSNWYLPMLASHYAVLASSLLALSAFDLSLSESLYPNNVYRKMTGILVVLGIVHAVSAVVSFAGGMLLNEDINRFHNPFIPLSNLDEMGRNISDAASSSFASTIRQDKSSMSDSTRDGVEPPNVTRNDSFSINEYVATQDLEQDEPNLRNWSNKRVFGQSYMSKILQGAFLQKLARNFGAVFSVVFSVTNFVLFIYLIVYMVIGVAVGNLFGKERHIFNLLAHWIKGGVFILLGILSFARYCGFGVERGWAWNNFIVLKNEDQNASVWNIFSSKNIITMEGIESFLIFFYGSTNVFLEHLGNYGGAWTAMDLQHASIAFMFIGCGLCGLLTEYLLREWRWNQVMKATKVNKTAVSSATPGFSPNPFPTMTIFWTGYLMSQHEQSSHLSTAVHMQWGNLLSYGSVFRLFTFLYLTFKPSVNCGPTFPFTEVITSFCLICGGLIFMESTEQVVYGMEYRGLTPMFTFNVSVGVVALLMAWEMSLFLWKNWLVKNRN